MASAVRDALWLLIMITIEEELMMYRTLMVVAILATAAGLPDSVATGRR